MFKVVVTDYEFDSLDIEKEELKKIDAILVAGQCKKEEEIIELAHDAHGILNQYTMVTEKVIDSLEKCKVIVRYGIGINTIDVAAATSKGIYVVNVPDYCIEEVAIHAFSLILSLARRVVFMNNKFKVSTCNYISAKPIKRLSTMKLGLLGFGNIARRVTKIAIASGFTCLSYDPYVSGESMKEHGCSKVDLITLLKESDFISIHVPLNKDTHHLIGEEEISMMKSTAYIINTSRGSIIDENALVEALVKNKIAGAALDVVEVEPIERDNPLLKLDNVILTPHVAWYSEEAMIELRVKAVHEIIRVLNGELPKSWVNKGCPRE